MLYDTIVVLNEILELAANVRVNDEVICHNDGDMVTTTFVFENGKQIASMINETRNGKRLYNTIIDIEYDDHGYVTSVNGKNFSSVCRNEYSADDSKLSSVAINYNSEFSIECYYTYDAEGRLKNMQEFHGSHETTDQATHNVWVNYGVDGLIDNVVIKYVAADMEDYIGFDYDGDKMSDITNIEIIHEDHSYNLPFKEVKSPFIKDSILKEMSYTDEDSTVKECYRFPIK